MNTSEQINELAAALAKAQAAIKPVVKDKTALIPTKSGGSYKYNYADLSSVWDTIRGALSSAGIAVVQSPELDGERVALTTMLAHSSGQWIASTISTRPTDMAPQAIGSAITYLRRYALAAMVGVVADEDDDGAAGTHGASGHKTSGASQAPGAPQTNGASPAHTNGSAATEKQLQMIYAVGKSLGYNRSDLDGIADQHGATHVDALTREQASAMITQLKEWEAQEKGVSR